ncbi:TM0106 family RecB-like putative nuclease (plasmid) [Coraliomargarita sp. W4R53]
MRYIEQEQRIIWSASDLKSAAECEFAWVRSIDARLGRVSAVAEPEDLTLARAGRLGTVHEHRVLDEYVATFGEKVVQVPEVRSSNVAGLADAVTKTNEALASDAAVIFQAAFSTNDFVGFADFLVRDDDGRWLVQDTKLARHARVTALMQLAAYVDQLDRLGIARSDRVQLLLGDGTVSEHEVDDLMPVFMLRRDRLFALIADRRLETGAAGVALAWGDPRGELDVFACGRCATCDAEVVASRDLLLVAGMRPVQRARFKAGGITTVDELVAAKSAPKGMSIDTFTMLRTQARLQLQSPAGGIVSAAVPAPAMAPPVPTYEVVAPTALAALPRPSVGDLYFDFEGDPLYSESKSATGGPTLWGIDYLFGWVDDSDQYTALWAHSFADERRALETFLDIVALRRKEHPDMHIYHYAPYEPTHLLAMAARYGVREADVDRLLADGIFVDLYPIVRRALRVGSRSYSIKKLEPLYMGTDVRTSDVQKGDDSIVRYVEACTLDAEGATAEARVIFDDLADYNRYDCVSTRRLRNWLVERAREAQLRPALNDEPSESVYEPSPRSVMLNSIAREHDHESPHAQSLRLAAAAIDYYPREAKSFWAMHYLRLREPVSMWEESKDVVVVDAARSRVLEDWHRPEGKRVDRRILELRGELAPGTRLSEGSNPPALYELPAPFPFEASPRWIHADHRITIVESLEDGAIVEEFAVDGETWDALPVALAPASPPRALNQQVAIDAWADTLIDAAPTLPADPATDLLARRVPRTRSGSLPSANGDNVDAITRAIIDLDRSYLAVQGPPGTGKTYVGSHVIARLVKERGFKVGVVAQSHAVVENMLARVVEAGLDISQVGKAPKDPFAGEHPFTVLKKNTIAGFTAEHQDSGYVIGGTAWDFAHETRVPRGSLDLLVVDEAGQFSLASTIAVSLASSRMLLLGDPQQLPQVSQGTHPEPVDTSALGWVMAGVDVISPEYGYFLGQTWRMHPEVASPVSRLSYRGELHAHPSTAHRAIEGIQAGVVPVTVRHRGNATASPEEAATVVALVQDLVGRAWTDARVDGGGKIVTESSRPLCAADIIVVTPYNAQQVTVEEALAAAGYGDTRVGTVDKFQGQEAAVSIVSLAASSGRDAPRGLEFLLLRNRLNVAISRAEHTAYIVHSPALVDDLPYTPEGMARLSAFARLIGRA